MDAPIAPSSSGERWHRQSRSRGHGARAPPPCTDDLRLRESHFLIPALASPPRRSACEDAQLTELVKQFGGKQWARIASVLPGRTGKVPHSRDCPLPYLAAYMPRVRKESAHTPLALRSNAASAGATTSTRC